ncbi:MBL fold metallo-hydrolase [Halomonas sp. WWR20]
MPHNPLQDVHLPMTSLKDGSPMHVLPDIQGLTVQIVNVYFVGLPDTPEDWVLVDTGMPHSADLIIKAAEARFGAYARPRAIILTHGHFDHVGSALELAGHWDVPVYAHAAEMPFVTGQQRYPYPDPSVQGGIIAKLSRFFPSDPVDLQGYIRALPDDGSIPGMPGWRWVHTPGHTPGHVSFFRDDDHALIVGDAFVTVRQDALFKVLTQHQEISGPPRYFTPDWAAARSSVQRLAELRPSVAVTGHGMPMAKEALREGLDELARRFDEIALPAHGRDVDEKK